MPQLAQAHVTIICLWITVERKVYHSAVVKATLQIRAQSITCFCFLCSSGASPLCVMTTDGGADPGTARMHVYMFAWCVGISTATVLITPKEPKSSPLTFFRPYWVVCNTTDAYIVIQGVCACLTWKMPLFSTQCFFFLMMNHPLQCWPDVYFRCSKLLLMLI